MIKLDSRILEGKSIEELDERFFKLNSYDELELTPFAEDKIAKAMKTFYGNKLKDLSISTDDFTYVTRSELQQIPDKEAIDKLKEQYQDEYKEIQEEYELMQKEYKDSHADEFELVETIDPATYLDEDGNWASVGGNLYELSCSNLQEAAIGYQTASAFLKDNNDTSSFPTIKKLQAKDSNNWKNELQKMRDKLLTKYPDAPKDLFNPNVTKEDYKYTINWRKTKQAGEDNKLLEEAANEYVKTMLE